MREEARRRALLRVASQAAQLAYNDEMHVDEAIGNVQAELIRLATPSTTAVRHYPYGGAGIMSRRWVNLRALDMLRRAALVTLAEKQEVS